MSNQFDDEFLGGLLRRLRLEPTAALEACQEEFAKVEAVHELATYRLIGFLCSYVAAIKKSPRRKKELLTHRFWTKRKPKEEDISLAATRFALKAKETKSGVYERARVYCKVIDYYASIKVDPKEVADRLAKMKIDGVLAQIAKLKEATREAGQSAGGTSSQPRQPTTAVVAKRADDRERVSGSLSSNREKAVVILPNANDDSRVRDTSDTVLHHRKFDLGCNNDDNDVPPQPSAPIQIDEEDDIYFSAGRHFSTFGRLKIGEEIVVVLRRDSNHEGRWRFRAISAEVKADEDVELRH